MRVAILQDDFPPHHEGGAGVVAESMVRVLRERGHEVIVITATRGEDEKAQHSGVVIYRLHSVYPMLLRAWLCLYNPQVISKVRKILRDFKPDIVHAHNVHTHLSYHTLKIGKQTGAKVFLTLHDAMSVHWGRLQEGERVSAWRQLKKYRFYYNPFRNPVIRHYLRYVDKKFAVSEALKYTLELNGVRGIEVIHNGIQTREWEVPQGGIQKFKERFGLLGKKIILFGGRLNRDKGTQQAVGMLAAVVSKVPETVLVVMGKEGAPALRMRQLAKEKGLEDHMIFTGWLSGQELKIAYHSSDVVCVLSTYLDPFPTVNLEAMACHKPVVGTCFGGTKEAVVDGETGYIVDPNDISAVAKKVVELLQDEKKARAMGERGYERAVRAFSNLLPTPYTVLQ